MNRTREQSFPRSARMAKEDFRLVLQKGRKRKTGRFLVYYRFRPSGEPRLGIIVSRRVGKACRRNRFKRLVREVFRKNRSRMVPGADLIIRAVPGHTPLEYHEVERILLETTEAIGMMVERTEDADNQQVAPERPGWKPTPESIGDCP